MTYPRVSTLKTADVFRARLNELGVSLPLDEVVQTGPEAPLARPFAYKDRVVGNRFAILPMEGWDSETDGRPSDFTRRRWRNFGLSGAKLIWGGEAVAVRPDARDNPRQMVLTDDTLTDIAALREEALAVHRERFSRDDDLLFGLQLIHSGRFSKPSPRILYRHPLLDARFGVRDDGPILSDDDISRLTDDFVATARLSLKAGFAFVDVKHCHGYLGHEFLSAIDRPGRYGGSLENRTRFLREVVSGIRAEAPGLHIGVRLSFYDFVPFQMGPDRVGIPSVPGPYPYAFGGDGSGAGIDLTEPSALLSLLESLGVDLVCASAGCPYYNPHILRPAAFPPSDGYLPPEDPLVGVARQIGATAELKARHPQLVIIGSGYSYLQEWLPNVGQAVLRAGGADFIGIGRMVLAYPDLPADILAGLPLARKRICRTFSECTTAARNGLVSGCYPLDPFYKALPENQQLTHIKERRKA